jgi:outer membrane biosynthesis protein TonB
MMADIFDTVNKKFDRQSKLKGIAVSIAVHIVVLFISIPILGLKAPNPPLDGGGVEVNFGTSDMGSGSIQPMNDNGQNAITNPPPSAAASPSSPDKDQNIVTQDVEDAPAMTQSKNKKSTVKKHSIVKKNTTSTVAAITPMVTSPKVTKSPPAPPAPTVDQRAIYKGAKGTPNNSTSEGPDNVLGDKGMPTGDPNAKSYTGNNMPGSGGSGPGGLGYGGKFSINGRKAIHFPKIKDASQKWGNVAVSIKVDKNGNVIEATYLLDGSTTNDSYLINLALKGAYQLKYESSSTPEEQGVIDFNFQPQ